MTSTTATPLRFAAPRAMLPWQAPPWSTEERLERIQALGQRINGYVQFMCQVDNLNGASAEAKEKAVVAFYEQMVVLERRLGRIQDDFQLE